MNRVYGRLPLNSRVHPHFWRLWLSSHKGNWKDMTNTDTPTPLSYSCINTPSHSNAKHACIVQSWVQFSSLLTLDQVAHYAWHANLSMRIELSHCWLISLPHTHSACQASEAVAPTSSSTSRGSGSSSSVDDETGECFGQGKRVAGRGADEQNAPSQLETKERPAKGPIAQSWLTQQSTSHTHTHIHTHAHT